MEHEFRQGDGARRWGGGFRRSRSALALACRVGGAGLLEGLGLPPDAREVSAVEVQGPDGSMPEIATRTFRISWPLETLQRFYVEACERAGFAEASAEGVRVEPELLSERGRTGDATWCRSRRSAGAANVG